jgi:hypothetical protein
LFYNSHLERIRKTFADQFEQDGNRIVYRKNLKGAPIEVSASEHEALVAQFDKRMKYLMALFMAFTVVMIVGAALLSFQINIEFSQPLAFGCGAIVLAPVLFSMFWAWNAPARLVAGRAPLGKERTVAEMHRIGFERLTWGRLGAAAAIALVMLLRVDWHRDLLAGGNPFWLLISGGLLVLCGVQAVRKLRAR